MSLRDDIRWVEPNFIITKEGRQRYQPIRQRDMVAVIDIMALRERLRDARQYWAMQPSATAQEIVGEYDELLAELEER